MRSNLVMFGLVFHLISAANALGQNKPGTYQPGAYQPYQPAKPRPPITMINLPRYADDEDQTVLPHVPVKEVTHPLDGAMVVFSTFSIREREMVSGINGIRRVAGEVPKYQSNVVTAWNLSESVTLLQEAYQRVLSAHSTYKIAMGKYRATLPIMPSSFRRAAEHYSALSKDPTLPEFVRNNYAKLAVNCEHGLAAAKLRAEQYEATDQEISKTMEQAKHVEAFLGNYERYLRLFPAHDPGKERANLLAELKVFIQGFAEFQRKIDTIVEPAPSTAPPTQPIVSNAK